MRYFGSRVLGKLLDYLSPDPIYSRQSRWIHGTLPRIDLRTILPESSAFDLEVVRPIDRTWMISIALEELCCLLLIERTIRAKNILEIGTWDGNTTLNLAANTEGKVVTIDLPTDFDHVRDKSTLKYSDALLYVTDRKQVGRQFRGHPLQSKIHQVFGDSAKLDWSVLGSPFDLIFIDGCHDFKYVASDTANARAHLAPRGAIVWHDYGMLAEVSRAVDMAAQSASDLRIYAIQGTRLAVGLNNADPSPTV
jgi:predicted O-methyltransferase YrrM